MSADPDDVTPLGIRNTGATVITYGAPTLPGAMFILAGGLSSRMGDFEALLPFDGIPTLSFIIRTAKLAGSKIL